ncbi:hypothetical protein [Nocardia gipuzkoensis]
MQPAVSVSMTRKSLEPCSRRNVAGKGRNTHPMQSNTDKLIDVLHSQARVNDYLLNELQARDAVPYLVAGFPFELPSVPGFAAGGVIEPEPITAEPISAESLTVYRPGDSEPAGVQFVVSRDGDVYERRPDGWQLYINDAMGERWGIPAHSWANLLLMVVEAYPHTIEPTEAGEPDEFSLSDAAAVLQRHGIKSGQRRLKAHLYAIGWTDGMNVPTESGKPFLVVAEPPNYDTGRNAVVRVTRDGVRALVERAGKVWGE